MAQTHFHPLLDSLTAIWNPATGQFDWEVSATISALQDRYVADPTTSVLLFSEFADTLKVAGEAGQQVIGTLRAQGNLGGDGFARLLGGLGIATAIGDAGNNTLHGSDSDDILFGEAGMWVRPHGNRPVSIFPQGRTSRWALKAAA